MMVEMKGWWKDLMLVLSRVDMKGRSLAGK